MGPYYAFFTDGSFLYCTDSSIIIIVLLLTDLIDLQSFTEHAQQIIYVQCG